MLNFLKKGRKLNKGHEQNLKKKMSVIRLYLLLYLYIIWLLYGIIICPWALSYFVYLPSIFKDALCNETIIKF